jgi:hypothetical protein
MGGTKCLRLGTCELEDMGGVLQRNSSMSLVNSLHSSSVCLYIRGQRQRGAGGFPFGFAPTRAPLDRRLDLELRGDLGSFTSAAAKTAAVVTLHLWQEKASHTARCGTHEPGQLRMH